MKQLKREKKQNGKRGLLTEFAALTARSCNTVDTGIPISLFIDFLTEI